MKLKNTKLRQGDEVIVVSGREKGKRGNIKKIVGDKCIVNDLNLAKKHTRPNPQLGITGGIVKKAKRLEYLDQLEKISNNET